MASLEPKDVILDIIARLRNRKARPDLEKISHMAKRKYDLTNNKTEEMLNKLIHDGIVNKVTYKGRTSYRNAAKCVKSKPNTESTNKKASAKLRDAIQSLSLTTSGGGSCFVHSTATGASGLNGKNQEKITNDTNNNEATSTGGQNSSSVESQLKLVAGVSRSQLECWWREQSLDAGLSKIDLNILIKNEITAGRIQTLPNGNYISRRGGTTAHSITKKTLLLTGEKRSHAASNKSEGGCNNLEQQSDKNSKHTSITTNKNTAPKPPCKRGRPASKRKKFLKDHGPDFQAEIPVGILGIAKCDFCLQPADSNGQSESLLSCKDCNSKVHPTCINYSPEFALRAQESPWQCSSCKVCNICQDSGNTDAMLICDLCDKGYHRTCLTPPLNKKPTINFVCSGCDKNKKKEKSPTSLKDTNDNNKGSCMYEPPTPCESPELPVTNFSNADSYVELQRRRSVYDGPYPNVTDYTPEEIVQFFKSKGFGKEANAFSEQEIDGKSLLLMKRDDVLMGLRDYICLGPALKIFKHIERLQWAAE